MESGIDIAIANLKSDLMSLKMELSEKRKKGFDTSIAQLHVMTIPSKIQMAQATKDPLDVQKAKQLLELVKKELSLAELKNEYILMKDEQVPEEKIDPPEDIGVTLNNLIQDAYLAIGQRNVKAALEHYGNIKTAYANAPPSLKKEIYPEIIQIYNEIKQLQQGAQNP